MFNFMKKAENWTEPTNKDFIQNYGVNDDVQNHGRSGALKTASYGLFSDLQPPFFKAFEKLGVPTNRAPVSTKSDVAYRHRIDAHLT